MAAIARQELDGQFHSGATFPVIPLDTVEPIPAYGRLSVDGYAVQPYFLGFRYGMTLAAVK